MPLSVIVTRQNVFEGRISSCCKYLDPLTGLKNRRMIIHNITSMMKNLRPGQELSFTMIDLNNFKSINDSFGHDTGDIALTIIGDAITTCMEGARNRSILYRYGGDEFAIILCSDDSSEIEQDLIAIRENAKMLAEER
ncbi:MAG: GGDEF domain-containing protein, partial [Bilifractor sp.]|nr:GGDEF domain-containing protein [Bilifractor sp.]